MPDGDRHDARPFRVLSLDGGGVRGYLSAKILANIEAYLNQLTKENRALGERFDLIVGTSTGGIIALALAAPGSEGRVTAAEVFRCYEQNLARIFTPRRGLARSWLKAKYGQEALRETLESILGNSRLSDALTPVVVTSVDVQNAKPRMHKSGYRARDKGRAGETMVDVALATSAAPTFFPLQNRLEHSAALADGGLCANNPVLVALTEALQMEHQKNRLVVLEEVVMLSVGTGEPCAMPYEIESLDDAGRIPWIWNRKLGEAAAAPVVELLLESQSALAHFQAEFLLKGAAYLRINPRLKAPFPLDDAGRIDQLKNLADIDQRIEEFLKRYFGL